MSANEGIRRLTLLISGLAAVSGTLLASDMYRWMYSHYEFQRLADSAEIRRTLDPSFRADPFWVFTEARVLKEHGVEEIRRNSHGQVASFIMADGRHLNDTTEPLLWHYLFGASLPFLAFFGTWTLFKGINWVLSGFGAQAGGAEFRR